MQNRNNDKKSKRYLVKTVRADERNYWRDFVLMITRSPQQQKKFPLRPKPKKAYTVDAEGVYLRSEKPPRHLPENKDAFSQLQSTTLVTENLNPPLFGHNTGRAAKLVGVKIARDHALLGRMLIYDKGTVNRPWDHFNEIAAWEYHKETTENVKILYADEEAFVKALESKQNEDKYNEVLARIMWGKGDAIIIGSDTLEARLLAQDYARILEERLKEQVKEYGYPSDAIKVPILYYLPQSKKHLKSYTQNEMIDDLHLGRMIARDPKKIIEKCKEGDYEFLLTLDKIKLIEVLTTKIDDTLILFKMLMDGYIHIFQSLMELNEDLINSIKVDVNFVAKSNATILYAPAKANEMAVLKWLLDLGFGSKAPVNARHPLVFAAEFGSHDAAKALIAWNTANEALNQNLQDNNDKLRILDDSDVLSALFFASRNGHAPVVKLLLNLADANPKMRMEYEVKKRHLTIQKFKTPLYAAAKKGHTDVVELLVKAIAKNSSMENNNSSDEILASIERGEPQALATAITVDTKEVVDAIKIAVKYGHVAVVKQLLPMVSEAIHADILKHTLTYDSVEITDLLFDSYLKIHKEEDIVRRLMVAIENNRDKAASFWARKVSLHPDLLNKYDPQIQKGFITAITKGMWKASAVMSQLVKDINHKDEKGFTSLYHAIKNGKLDFAKILIDKGADFKIEAADGSNLFFVAKDFFTITFLTDLELDIHKTNAAQKTMYQVIDENEETLLFQAVKTGDLRFVKYLLSIGSDVNHLNKQAKSPLYYAIEAGNLEMVRLLILNGALLSTKTKNVQFPQPISLILYATNNQNQEFAFNMLAAAFERDAEIDKNDVSKQRTIDCYVENLDTNSRSRYELLAYTFKDDMKQFNAMSMKAKSRIFALIEDHGYTGFYEQFNEIVQYDRDHVYMPIKNKARYLWNNDLEWGRYSFPPLVKAELLIDLLESEELKHAGIIKNTKTVMLSDLIFSRLVKDRKCKDIVETALENAEAAVLLLMSGYGPLLENADRIKIIKKWENSPYRDYFLEAVSELPAETKAYGEGLSPLAFTLSKTWMFSTDRKMMQEVVEKRATVKSDKYQIGKSFLAFADQLNSWFTKHKMLEGDKKLQTIESAYHKQAKDNLSLTVNKDEAMMANEISFLFSLTELVTQELNKHPTVPHHKIFLGQILSELDDVMVKGLDKVDQHLSLQ